MNTEYCFNHHELEPFYNRYFSFKSLGLFNVNMPSFSIRCVGGEKEIYTCNMLANQMRRKTTIEYVGDPDAPDLDFFGNPSKTCFVTLYDNYDTEPTITLGDILQNYYNTLDFWNRYNIPPVWRYLTVDKSGIFLHTHEPNFIELFFSERWYTEKVVHNINFLGDEGEYEITDNFLNTNELRRFFDPFPDTLKILERN